MRGAIRVRMVIGGGAAASAPIVRPSDPREERQS